VERIRNIRLDFSPSVNVEGDKIRVTSGSHHGDTKYVASGTLSMWCAASLIKSLRKAMRQIRREQLTMANSAINEAEQTLSD
jgi:hypothetical protein